MAMRMALAVAAVALCCSISAQAQMSGSTGNGPAAGDKVAPSKSAEALLRIFEGECVGVAKTMPADKFAFSPAGLAIAGAKFDGVRTFGEQVKHLAGANFYFASIVAGTKPEMDDKAIGALTSKDQIVGALTQSFAALHKANASLTPENAFEIVNFEGQKAPRMMVADFAVAHGYDHYGQMVEYLRMNGLVPPGSK